MLTLETALLILEKFDAVALTDTTGKYIYANEKWFETSQIDRNSIQNMYPWEVFSDSKVKLVLQTQEPLLGQVINVGDRSGIVNYYPITKDGNFFGVLIWTFFSAIEIAAEFSKKMEHLSRELKLAKKQLADLTKASYSINCIVGESEATRKLKQEIIDAARTNSTVMIEGETGSGKELVAHSIHDLSQRSQLRFVRVNCSAIPPELLESEFFGYEDGSFTGARKGGHKGKFEAANGGSIFFDEINSLPMTMQPKFLRVLQERELERIGGKDTIPVDVRVIAATNTPLEPLIDEGKFREDLYYRLNVLRIRVAPLRERLDDLELLTKYLVDKLNHMLNMDISYVEEEVFSLFRQYHWPGNIRELQNVLERAMNHCRGSVLTPEHFLFFNQDRHKHVKDQQTITAKKNDLEKSEIIEKLEKHNGNKSATAEDLGLSRTALYKKIKKYGL